MEKKKVLCVYATRQIDSNLFMSSTVFRGLKEAGYETYMYFAGTRHVIEEFERNYRKFFDSVIYQPITESWLKKKSDRHPITRLGYSFYRHFLIDSITHTLNNQIFTPPKFKSCDCILSFVPPILSGRLAIELRKRLGLGERQFIQFWTDPLSLGRCDSIADIPKSRFVHKWQEHKLLKFADKIVFCYPLLCEMEQKLHPQYSGAMTWSDISYTEHPICKHTVPNAPPIIGFFGAYQNHVRNISPLIHAIKALPQYNFIIRGDGDLPFEVDGIPNLDIAYGRRPLSEIEQLESKCDVLLSISGKSGITHPAGKTFYYASYPKPIVHIGDGINTDYFKNYIDGFVGRFIYCINDENSIAAAIHKAIDSLPSFVLKIPQRMDAAVIARKIIEQ